MGSERVVRLGRFALSLLVAFGLVCVEGAREASAEPSAADKETARHLMKLGEEKLAAKDFKAALSSFESAHLIMKVPSTGLAVAKALAGLGQLVEARALALEIARSSAVAGEPAAFEQARGDAGAFAKELEARVASLEVQIEGAPEGAKLEVSVDGHLVPPVGARFTRRLNPGKHVVTAVAEGLPPSSAQVELAEGASEKLSLRVGSGAKGGELGGGLSGDTLVDVARYREGFHVGVGAAPLLVLPLTGGAWFGGSATAFVNYGLSERIDARLGASGTMLGTTGGDGVLNVTMPVSLRFHVASRYTVSAGFNGGFFHIFSEYPDTGFAAGPEWSVVGLRLGDRREIELDFVQGFRFYVREGGPPTYYNGFALSYLFLDD